MDPSVLTGIDNLPSYMIFVLLLVWMVLNFFSKTKQAKEQVSKEDESLKLLRSISENLRLNGERFAKTLDNTERLLALGSTHHEDTILLKQQALEMHQALLGDTARLPNGGLKWYNDPEIVSRLITTHEHLSTVIQSLETCVRQLSTQVRQMNDQLTRHNRNHERRTA